MWKCCFTQVGGVAKFGFRWLVKVDFEGFGEKGSRNDAAAGEPTVDVPDLFVH